jgi:hypothetical protein
MSNIKAAKEAIKAELAHVKSGLDYYMARAKALEQTLASLVGLGEEHAVAVTKVSGPAVKQSPSKKSVPKAKTTPKAKSETKTKPVKTSAGADTKPGSELPFTGGDFWPGLITDQPQSASEIQKAAIAKLGFAPTKDQVKQLSGRQTFAINTLVKQKKIQDSGSGRERRFFKK